MTEKVRTGLTVEQLINELQQIEDHTLPVFFAYNYGDYWRTEVAAAVDATSEERVKPSMYQSLAATLDEDKLEAEPEDDQVNCVVLR